MKILLIGDFSGAHNALNSALKRKGHQSTLISSGDFKKEISSDYFIGIQKDRPFRFIQSIFRTLETIKKLENYDIVQYISPTTLSRNYLISKLFWDFIRRNNKKVFYYGAGICDPYTVRYYMNSKNPNRQNYFKHVKKSRIWFLSQSGERYFREFEKNLDGYIPSMQDYAGGWQEVNHPLLKEAIPLPCDFQLVKPQKKKFSNKLTISHISSRPEKGSDIILEAISRLEKKIPQRIELSTPNFMPFHKYLEYLNEVHLSVDQLYSSAWGMNAIYSMAAGCVVLGGGDNDAKNYFNLNTTPIIDINQNNIEQVIVSLLDKPAELEHISYKSKKFVAEFHDSDNIAEKFLEVWSK